jgi:hypothetical protein
MSFCWGNSICFLETALLCADTSRQATPFKYPCMPIAIIHIYAAVLWVTMLCSVSGAYQGRWKHFVPVKHQHSLNQINWCNIYGAVQVRGNRLLCTKDITDHKNIITQTFTCVNITDIYDPNVCTYNSVDVHGSVHHSTIHKEKSNKMQQCIKILLFHIYMKLSMFRATRRPSSGA